MQEFQHGPFEFAPTGRAITINGINSQRWEMHYSNKLLAEITLAADASRAQIIEAFADARTDFVRRHQPAAPRCAVEKADIVRLVRSTAVTGVRGEMLGAFEQRAEIAGLASGLIDDRFETWLINPSGQCLPMGAEEFQRLADAHGAIAAAERALSLAQAPRVLPRAWIAELLPADVLTQDPGQWRAPTHWELRHVIGEGSFTGITGAGAAALVGVTPQNFRKYTARVGANTRQAISYAMWHLLLHRLGVQSA